MSFLSKITLPDGSTYDLRDNKAGHYLGTSTTTISAGTISGTIVVNGTTYSLNPTGSQVALRDQDIVKDDADLLYIAIVSGNTGSRTGTWVALTTPTTMSITDVKVDNTSVLDGTVAKIATTGSLTGGTAYNATTNPLATKAYVDELPEPMIFKGGIKLTADSSDTTKVSISDGSGQALLNVKEGYTYKVTNIASSPTYTGTLKLGDTFIADKDSPVTTIAWVEGTDWTIIPSGDEPSGTVTSVGISGNGLGTSEANDGAITTSGTINLKLAAQSTTSTQSATTKGNTTNREYALGVDKDGNLAVNIPWTDTTYTADTGIQVTSGNMIQHTNSVTADNTKAVKRVTFDAQGHITAGATAATTTVAATVATAAPGQTAPDNAVTYYAYDDTTETLSLYQLGYTTEGDIVKNVDAT